MARRHHRRPPLPWCRHHRRCLRWQAPTAQSRPLHPSRLLVQAPASWRRRRQGPLLRQDWGSPAAAAAAVAAGQRCCCWHRRWHPRLGLAQPPALWAWQPARRRQCVRQSGRCCSVPGITILLPATHLSCHMAQGEVRTCCRPLAAGGLKQQLPPPAHGLGAADRCGATLCCLQTCRASAKAQPHPDSALHCAERLRRAAGQHQTETTSRSAGSVLSQRYDTTWVLLEMCWRCACCCFLRQAVGRRLTRCASG